MSATTFLSGLSNEVKPYVCGIVQGPDVTRYPLVNSRDHNRKIIRLGQTDSTQFLGIDAPSAAATNGGGGAGADLFYRYVYVNHLFIDPLALEPDPFIRGNASPPSVGIPSAAGAPTVLGTGSTDPQVTHAWLYVAAAVDGPYVRLDTGYEIPNVPILSWTGTMTVPTAGYFLELDNSVPDTCRIAEQSNGFFCYAGFVPITGLADATNGNAVITASGSTAFHDGIVGLNFQFNGDTTGGPSNNGIYIAQFTDSTHLALLNPDGTADPYDGGNKTGAAFRIWRDASIIQISKRYNPDGIPGIIDPDFIIRGPGAVTAIAKPQTGFAMRFHFNNGQSKSVTIADFSQGIPVREIQTASVYAAANPRAWASAGGRMFYYDFDSGIIEDRGMNHVPLTLGVIPNLIRSLAKNSNDISEMEYDDVRNLILLSVVPSGYTRSYFMIVYNLSTNSFNLWFMIPDVLSMRRVKDVATGNVYIRMGSTGGSYTSWPSLGYNEAVGSSIAGSVASNDDSTHLTVIGTPFPTSGDKLKDRWVMAWDDLQANPTYQFARISDNTNNRLTLDAFIGPNSTVAWSPVPTVGWAYWVGPIQCILGPNYEYNSVPDDDGQTYDVAMTTSGLDVGAVSRLSVFRNFETSPVFGQSMIHNKYQDGSTDPDHQSVKMGAIGSVEEVGVTGWQITDNNEAPLSIKAIVRRVKQIAETLNQKARK